MNAEQLIRYLSQLTCERMKNKKEPRFPVIDEVFDFINRYEKVDLQELKEGLNALYKAGKIRVSRTLNSQQIELVG